MTLCSAWMFLARQRMLAEGIHCGTAGAGVGLANCTAQADIIIIIIFIFNTPG